MKAKRLEEVNFSINILKDDNDQLNLTMKEGQLFLSVAGLLLGDENSWYELPVQELKDLSIVDEEPLKLKFDFENIEVTITGKNPQYLMALRHFLLPFIADAS